MGGSISGGRVSDGSRRLPVELHVSRYWRDSKTNFTFFLRYPSRCLYRITQITVRVPSDTTPAFIIIFSHTTCFDQADYYQVFILYKNLKLKVKM
jgi:hypothetical protein